MSKKSNSGYLFILSGVLFLFAGLLGDQLSFYGVAIMFAILGAVTIAKNKSSADSQQE
ncbi:hypothetical protein Q4489_10420 [Thalassotalea sp. 1_MG-2023]|uniref:hypothetical protein n=1 Tax=Thalassotalea sp. 1_MG-2023 TaxID=3062680 RepID=UPI0026E393C5|nr:hypothetical protein [Thalassotalea sp. 1_MG-2023]MDO6427431.1 hypothetical protein [Thalassotalea sp. 1_MG-2023]